MTRKLGTPRQQKTFPCQDCEIIFKKNSLYIAHMKEQHGIEK